LGNHKQLILLAIWVNFDGTWHG